MNKLEVIFNALSDGKDNHHRGGALRNVFLDLYSLTSWYEVESMLVRPQKFDF